MEDALQTEVAGGSEDGGDMAVREGALHGRQVADAGDGDGAFQDGPEAPGDRRAAAPAGWRWSSCGRAFPSRQAWRSRMAGFPAWLGIDSMLKAMADIRYGNWIFHPET